MRHYTSITSFADTWSAHYYITTEYVVCVMSPGKYFGAHWDEMVVLLCASQMNIVMPRDLHWRCKPSRCFQNEVSM